jgi:hypothetical protein
MAQTASNQPFDPSDVFRWTNEQLSSKEISEISRLALQPTLSMIQMYIDTLEKIEMNEWHRRVQIQAVLFNMGIVISINCASFLPYIQTTNELAKLNDAVMHEMVGEHARLDLKPIPTVYAIVFFRMFLVEIRKLICANRRGKGVIFTGATASTVATWILQKFGMLEPFAVGLSALLLIAIGTAARNAFCEITDETFMNALEERDKVPSI